MEFKPFRTVYSDIVQDNCMKGDPELSGEEGELEHV